MDYIAWFRLLIVHFLEILRGTSSANTKAVVTLASSGELPSHAGCYQLHQ